MSEINGKKVLDEEEDQFYSQAIINGTAGDDILFGTDNDDVINPGLGNDIVYAGGGNDKLSNHSTNGSKLYFLGSGNDTVSMSHASAARVYGEDGDDLLIGTYIQNARFDGGAGNDLAYLVYSAGEIHDTGGFDRIFAYYGNYQIHYYVEENQNVRDIISTTSNAPDQDGLVVIHAEADLINEGWITEAVNHFNAKNLGQYQYLNSFDPNGEYLDIIVRADYMVVDTKGVNDNPMGVRLTNNEIAEDAAVGTVLGTVSSYNEQGEVPVYYLLDNYNGAFAINALTGEITLNQAGILDFETDPQVSITVHVNDGTGKITNETFTIQIGDVPDSPPPPENTPPENVRIDNNNVAENSRNGTVIGTVASDNDSGETPSYSLIDDADGRFTIDASTGEVMVNDSVRLDYESAQQHSITVRVDDGTGLTTDQAFTINVFDVEEIDTAEYSGLLNGAGQTVVVFDTGLDYNVEAFKDAQGNSRMVDGKDFANGDNDPFDDHYHGTHVTSIVASSGSLQRGWAPEADIIAIKVLSASGGGSFSAVEQGLQYLIENFDQYENQITTMNFSLGTGNTFFDEPPAFATLENEFAALKDLGVFTAVAAGNSYSAGRGEGVGYPAASHHVVPVASHNVAGTALSGFSQRADDVIATRGDSVNAYIPERFSTDTASLSGTSMASPQLAGASMQLRELMEIIGMDDVNQATIYNHMRETANLLFDATTNNSYHQLNMVNAVQALLPEDEAGDTAQTSAQLGELLQGATVSGFISAEFQHDSAHNGKVVGIENYDIDYFSFSATMDGTLYLTASPIGKTEIAIDWLIDVGELVLEEGNTIGLAVNEGDVLTIGLSSHEGIGYYDISAAYGIQIDSQITTLSAGDLLTDSQSDSLESVLPGESSADLNSDFAISPSVGLDFTLPVLTNPLDQAEPQLEIMI